MSSIVLNDDRRFDDYTSRLSFNAPAGCYVQQQYHMTDAAGADCRTYSDAASYDSSRSPEYRTFRCRSAAVDASESPKTPGDTASGLSRYLNRHQHPEQQQPPPPVSFAIHQLLGLGADIRNLDVNYERGQLAFQTVDGRHHPHTPPTHCRCEDCTRSFNPDVDASLSSPNYPDHRGPHQLDLPYYDRSTSASVAAAYYRQRHGLTAVAATKWPYLRETLQIPTPLTPWSNDEPHLPRKTDHHHQQQQQQQQHEPQHHYDELQAYYCAARLQPSSVDVQASYDSVIRQCRNISYLPPNFGMSAA